MSFSQRSRFLALPGTLRFSTLRLVGLGALLIFASSCSLLREPKDKEAQTITLSAPQCLSEMNHQITDYFHGKLADEAHVPAISDCASGSLQYFMQFTKGQESGSYSPEELRDFLNKYMAPSSQISDSFFLQIMRLKASMFGGDPKRLTRQELTRISEWLTLLGKNFSKLHRFMPMITAELAKLPEKETRELTELLIKAAREVGGFFKDSGGTDYAFADLDRFLAELDEYLSATEQGHRIRMIREQIPVLAAMKPILMGTSEKLITRAEWPELLIAGAKIHDLLVLIERHKDAFEHWDREGNLEIIQKVVSPALEVLTSAAKAHPAGVIPAAQFDRLTEVLARMLVAKNQASREFTVTLADATAKALLFKEVLLGNAGDLDELSIAGLQPLFQATKGPLRALAPFLPELDFTKLDRAGMENLSAALLGSGTELGAALNEFHSRRDQVYSFQPFRRIYPKLLPLLRDSQPWLERCETWERVSVNLKSTLFGPPNDQLTARQWAGLVEYGASFFRIYGRMAWAQSKTARPQKDLDTDLLIDTSTEALQLVSKIASDRPLQLSEVVGLVASLPLSDKTRVAAVDFMPELLKAKQALAGGTADTLRAGEALLLVSFIKEAKPAIDKLLPFFPFQLSQLPNWDQAKLAEFSAALGFAGKKLGAAFSKAAPQTYSTSSLADFFAKLEGFEATSGFAKQARAAVPVLGALKALLSGGSAQRITGAEWQRFSTDLGELAGLAVQGAALYGSPDPLVRGTGLAQLERTIKALFALGERSIGYQRPVSGTRAISFEHFDLLIENSWAYFKSQGIDPAGLRSESVRTFLRSVISRMMGGKFHWERHESLGLSQLALDRTWTEIDRWIRSQRALEKLYLQFGKPQVVFASDGFTREELLPVLERMQASPANDKQALADIKYVLQTFPPFFRGRDQTMSFLFEPEKERHYSHNNITIYNTASRLADRFLVAYPADANRAKARGGANRLDLLMLFNDVWTVGQELKIFHNQSPVHQVAPQRFRDGDLFTAHSDGNGLLSPEETTNLLLMLYGAMPLSKKLHEKMAERCPVVGKDDRGRAEIDVQCYRQTIWNADWFNEQFGRYLPRFAQFLRVLRPNERDRFIRSAEIVARLRLFSNYPMDSLDTDGFVGLFNYVEGWFARFDANQDGVMVLPEVLAAFPIVCREIEAATAGTLISGNCEEGDTANLEALFGYVIAYGAPPDRPPNLNFWNSVRMASSWAWWSTKWWAIRGAGCDSCVEPVDRARMTEIIAGFAGP